MSVRSAAALARHHGAHRALIEARPETGPWLAHPIQVVALIEAARADFASPDSFEDALVVGWTCELLAETAIGVVGLTAAIGRNRSALARMASRAVRGVDKTAKSAEVFWRVVSRGPAPVRAAAACAQIARLDAADRWLTDADVARLRAETRRYAIAVTGDLPFVRARLHSALHDEPENPAK